MNINNFNKTIQIYLCINKNGSIGMHLMEPSRDDTRGLWISKMPFCNSLAYDQFKNLLEKSNMSWNSEPEPVTLNI